MKCKRCGAPLVPNAYFCGNCGCKITMPNQTGRKPAGHNENKADRKPVNQKLDHEKTAKKVKAAGKGAKTAGKLPWIIGGIAGTVTLVTALVIGLVVWNHSKRDDSAKRTVAKEEITKQQEVNKKESMDPIEQKFQDYIVNQLIPQYGIYPLEQEGHVDFGHFISEKLQNYERDWMRINGLMSTKIFDLDKDGQKELISLRMGDGEQDYPSEYTQQEFHSIYLSIYEIVEDEVKMVDEVPWAPYKVELVNFEGQTFTDNFAKLSILDVNGENIIFNEYYSQASAVSDGVFQCYWTMKYNGEKLQNDLVFTQLGEGSSGFQFYTYTFADGTLQEEKMVYDDTDENSISIQNNKEYFKEHGIAVKEIDMEAGYADSIGSILTQKPIEDTEITFQTKVDWENGNSENEMIEGKASLTEASKLHTTYTDLRKIAFDEGEGKTPYRTINTIDEKLVINGTEFYSKNADSCFDEDVIIKKGDVRLELAANEMGHSIISDGNMVYYCSKYGDEGSDYYDDQESVYIRTTTIYRKNMNDDSKTEEVFQHTGITDINLLTVVDNKLFYAEKYEYQETETISYYDFNTKKSVRLDGTIGFPNAATVYGRFIMYYNWTKNYDYVEGYVYDAISGNRVRVADIYVPGPRMSLSDSEKYFYFIETYEDCIDKFIDHGIYDEEEGIRINVARVNHDGSGKEVLLSNVKVHEIIEFTQNSITFIDDSGKKMTEKF